MTEPGEGRRGRGRDKGVWERRVGEEREGNRGRRIEPLNERDGNRKMGRERKEQREGG